MENIFLHWSFLAVFEILLATLLRNLNTIQFTPTYLVSEFSRLFFDTVRMVSIVINAMVETSIGLKFKI